MSLCFAQFGGNKRGELGLCSDISCSQMGITRGYHRPAFVGIEWGYDDTYWELNAGVDMYYRGIINDG